MLGVGVRTRQNPPLEPTWSQLVAKMRVLKPFWEHFGDFWWIWWNGENECHSLEIFTFSRLRRVQKSPNFTLFPGVDSGCVFHPLFWHFDGFLKILGSPGGPWGGVHGLTFLSFFELWAGWGPKCLQELPQDSPEPPQASIFTSFLERLGQIVVMFRPHTCRRA